ncbi:MAG: serine protease [Alphaproteobacteria bacterium]|nr:serine protease [Alphaproteobacteria bacterium]
MLTALFSVFSAFASAPTYVTAGVQPDALLPQVVGGAPAAQGSWPSTVMIIADSGYQVCTGTLVKRDVVLTAAHCVVGINVTHVITGSVEVTQSGTWIPVTQAVPHPTYSAQGGSDIAVLRLQSNSPDPRVLIASGCVADQYVYDGAPAAIVGFGAISYDGQTGTTHLHEAYSTIRDADCSQDQIDGQWTTCDPGERPGKELFAGGYGIDACFGDSGGPLYIEDQYGELYLAGVTSRGSNDQYGNPCGGGGVWVRPDAHIGWIESIIGESLPVASCEPPAPDVEEEPEPVVPDPDPAPVAEGADWRVIGDTLVVKKDTLGALQLTIEAADPSKLSFEIAQDGALGSAEATADGLVLYRPLRHAVGADTVWVRVIDQREAVDLAIEVQITSGGGCSTAGSPGGLLAMLAGLLLVARRR